MNLNASHISAIQGAHALGFKAAVLDGIGAVAITLTRDEDDAFLLVTLPGNRDLFVEVH